MKESEKKKIGIQNEEWKSTHEQQQNLGTKNEVPYKTKLE